MRINGHIQILLLSVLSLIMYSCSYGDDIRNLQNRVDTLESAVAALEKAYSDGKIITDVKARGDEGFDITFSDHSTIFVSNGIAGVTPLLRIDTEGFWTVSYDNGKNYSRLEDASGENIHSAGLCVRIAVNDKGCFRFEVYDPRHPDVTIYSSDTSLPADPARVLQSVTRDDKSGTITLTMADGTAFRFNLDVAYPTGIVVLTERIGLTPGAEAEFEFRVNPSNSFSGFNIEGEDANLELDLVGTRAGDETADSYVTPPQNYKLVSVQPSRNAEGQIKEGQFKAVIRDLGKSPAYQERVVLTLTTVDGAGRRIQLSSSLIAVETSEGADILSLMVGDNKGVETSPGVIEVKLPAGVDAKNAESVIQTNGATIEAGQSIASGPGTVKMRLDLSRPLLVTVSPKQGMKRQYKIVAHYSNLPVVYITTPSPITSKEDWTDACELQIWNAGADNAVLATQIKGRGNSTWSMPKKPYAIKLGKKSEVLGMKAHKRWCLLANYIDRTLMRNDVALEIARRMEGLDWTPSGRFVDLVVNGKFQGNYYLCEQIRVDENRVNITEMKAGDTDENSITGGYLLEFDIAYDEVNKFKTSILNFPVNIKEPDEKVLGKEQFEYITHYVNDMESQIVAKCDETMLRSFIDVDSWVDYFLVMELTGNGECSWPKSVYMHKDRGSVMHLGPVWDFDWGTFSPRQGWITDFTFLFRDLFYGGTFTNEVNKRWPAAEKALATIFDYIDLRAEEIRESESLNSKVWPCPSGFNYDYSMTFDEAVAALKNELRKRIDFINANPRVTPDSKRVSRAGRRR